MSNSGASRVLIPSNVRKTIQNIKEITSNHSEEDIYAMLKECSMDPNETTQRLLHLDTFHEVKRKPYKRKENVKNRSAEESRWKPGYQGRGVRGARERPYSQYSSNDSGGRRNAATRKENGVLESRERDFRHSRAPVPKETDSIQPHAVEKSSSINMNGPVKMPNGVQSSGIGDGNVSKENIDASVDNSLSTEHAPSASDPVLVPSCDSWIPTAVGAIKREVQIHLISAEPSMANPVDRGLGAIESISNTHVDRHEPQNGDGPQVSSSMSEKEAFGHMNIVQQKISGVEEATLKLEKLKFSNGQHVIIPSHIQVPDAVKNVLSFGSLDARFGVRENYITGESNKNSDRAADDETAGKTSSCDQDGISLVPEEKCTDHPQSPSPVPRENSTSDTNLYSTATLPKDDQLKKEETLPAIGPPFPMVQTTPSYNFGFMPPMLGNPLVPLEGFESQAHVSSSLSGSSPATSTSTSNPPPPPTPTQSAGVGRSPATVSPHSIPLFRQPYPPNYIPYSHYFSPFYVPPTMHQYFAHTGFPPPPLPTGNVYLSPAGIKSSPAPYKPGAVNTGGNQAPVVVPSGYGAYNSSQIGYSPNPPLTSGSSSSSEDLGPSGLKENNIYLGQQSEGSAVWFPGAGGRVTPNFPFNSYLNLPPPQGQHVIAPQPGHGAFAVYHTLQPTATSSPGPGLTLLHPSQTMEGSMESSVGPPSNAYHQPQGQHQINWNVE